MPSMTLLASIRFSQMMMLSGRSSRAQRFLRPATMLPTMNLRILAPTAVAMMSQLAMASEAAS